MASSLLMATVVNLGIGLLPLLDNFAHVGGFVCGFLMGNFMLIRRRLDYFGEVKNTKCYQIGFASLSMAVLVLGFLIGFVLLFTNVDPHKSCTWCKYMSCVETPWWDCPS